MNTDIALVAEYHFIGLLRIRLKNKFIYIDFFRQESDSRSAKYVDYSFNFKPPKGYART